VRLRSYPSASLTSRFAPARYAQEGSCPSYAPTCELNGINPELYLADVLLRVQTHPNARIDELLSHLWKPLQDADSD
jgi:hypothetical protein